MGGLGDQALGHGQRQGVRDAGSMHIQSTKKNAMHVILGGLPLRKCMRLVGRLQEAHDSAPTAASALRAGAKHVVPHRSVPEQHAHPGEQGAIHLDQAAAVVLGEDVDGIAEVVNGLDKVLLLAAELGRGLLADRRRLLQGLCVLCYLLLHLRDLSRRAAESRAAAFDLRGELDILGLGVRDGPGLLLFVGLAPADHLVIHGRLVLRLGTELRLHLAEKRHNALDRTRLRALRIPLPGADGGGGTETTPGCLCASEDAHQHR
mmetsp:Transcript_1474/g.5003  ORF Transcript_1474/g.5003 Transcript_1474/m.5003 type:complete len:262 (-) Transcript_1474:94-879(-)